MGNESLEGRNVVVTGASRGIGRAIAARLAGMGARLALVARESKHLRELAESLKGSSMEAVVIPADLRVAAEVESVVPRAVEAMGGIDVLINNAGVMHSASVATTSDDAWREIMLVNLEAPFRLLRAVIPHMLERGSGRIVNILSGAARNGIVDHGAYCASKFALLGLSESLALEVRNHGIRVHCVLPGSVVTSLGGTQRSVQGKLLPEDVAEVVAQLCVQGGNAWTSEVVIRPLVLTK